jgi:hypothetical protein
MKFFVTPNGVRGLQRTAMQIPHSVRNDTVGHCELCAFARNIWE